MTAKQWLRDDKSQYDKPGNERKTICATSGLFQWFSHELVSNSDPYFFFHPAISELNIQK